MKRLFFALTAMMLVAAVPAQSTVEKCLSGDCNNGHGTYRYSSGDLYTGEFSESMRNGFGIYTWNTGDKYYGEFSDDALQGWGVLYFKSGIKYIGEFKNGVRSGEGMNIYTDGSKDVGLFEEDKYKGAISYYGNASDATGCLYGDCENGYGVYRHTAGDRYFGYFKDGLRSGYGVYYYASGTKYIGDWAEGKINGYGVFYFAKGDKYIGEFNNVKKEGWGTYYYLDGSKATGLWESDAFVKSKADYLKESNNNRCITGDCENGYGQYIFDNGLYMGYWKEGYMHGEGLYVFDTGDYYDGTYHDNKRSGDGTFYFTDGGKYVGGFLNQYLSGEGAMMSNDGLLQEGYWENGYYVGEEPTANYNEVVNKVNQAADDKEYKKRLALVIGNSTYPGNGFLKNPVNDAREITRILKNSGFEVIVVENGSNRKITDAIREFGEKLSSYSVGLFYYSGHGMQVDGANYIIPVDAVINDMGDVRYECVDAGRVLSKMEYAGTKINIMIMDACRNNPFGEKGRSNGPVVGLAPMDAPVGTFIAYSTAPNKTASDGVGSNGLYTEELLKYLSYPNLKIEDLFKQVRVKVLEKSGGVQVPWETSSLTGDFYFVKQ